MDESTPANENPKTASWLPPTTIELSLPDSEISLTPSFLAADDADKLLAELISDIAWEQRDIQLFGKTFKQPRLIAWHGDAGASYTYSGTRFEPRPWTKPLQRVRDAVSTSCKSPLNSVLLNLYRDGRDSMGMHADDEPELGPNPVIGSVSLGAERVLTLRHRYQKDQPSRRIPLPHGSLLVMRGPTQQYWKHGIAKQRRACAPRINLTFRHIVGLP
ncbi:MAG: alpha-ketoglutarate-dependent dioxygenase AlkB [Pseudomonadota bacterium]